MIYVNKFIKNLLVLLLVNFILICDVGVVFASEVDNSDEIIDIVINLSDIVAVNDADNRVSMCSTPEEGNGVLYVMSSLDNSVAATITFSYSYEYNDGVDVYLLSVSNDTITGSVNYLAQWYGMGTINNDGNTASYKRLFTIYNQVTGKRQQFRFIFNCDMYGQEDWSYYFYANLN